LPFTLGWQKGFFEPIFNSRKEIMDSSRNYDHMIRALREFFQKKRGFIEIPAQSRLSILAACEQPETITQFTLNGTLYPLPQTGQMWLEHEILKNPEWPGVFCITTSYRDEQNPIPGRHYRIFPMFEFEAVGDLNDLRDMERELLLHLGFEEPKEISYLDACKKYQTPSIEAPHELLLAAELGSSISLEFFPEPTSPFWNMKYAGNGLYKKIDVLLHGMETIGSAERETDIQRMREQFFKISNGTYSQLLFSKFGEKRILAELETYLALPMIKRYGGGIGLTRLERAMELEGIFKREHQRMPLAEGVL
jgi:aspartyl/asparaginyl-tRNA synthetase